MNRKVLARATLARRLAAARRAGQRVVFTNGCFDLIHPGHVRYLGAARALGDLLVVGVNSDASVRRLGKGKNRPLVAQEDRAEVVAALRAVDFVTIFDEDTPLALIRALRPDVLVKGGDWHPDAIVGADFVRAHGGSVHSLPFAAGHSTTALLQRVASSKSQIPNPKSGSRSGPPRRARRAE